jgi:hypothetical protein
MNPLMAKHANDWSLTDWSTNGPQARQILRSSSRVQLDRVVRRLIS